MLVLDKERLLNNRVRIYLETGDEHVGFLRGVPPSGGVVLQDETWKSTLYLNVVRVELEQFTCSQCGSSSNTDYNGVCVHCSRAQAAHERAKGVPPTPCDHCGKPGAFRSPFSDDNTLLLCAQCHAKRGSLPADFRIIARSMREYAACVNSDVDSPEHNWRAIGRSRWRCKGYGCNANRYTPPKE